MCQESFYYLKPCSTVISYRIMGQSSINRWTELWKNCFFQMFNWMDVVSFFSLLVRWFFRDCLSFYGSLPNNTINEQTKELRVKKCLHIRKCNMKMEFIFRNSKGHSRKKSPYCFKTRGTFHLSISFYSWFVWRNEPA